MRKIILLAVLALAVAATPALASVQNVKVSGTIDSTYLFRENFNLGATDVDGSSDNPNEQEQQDFITQTTLRVDADLTDQVSATVALINERAWEQDPNINKSDDGSDNEVAVYLAYVTLREMLYSPLTVIIGRQDFRYGNSLIMDSAGTNDSAFSDSDISAIAGDLTKQTTLDAIRIILDYNPLTIEGFFSQIDQNTHGFSDLDDSSNLWGINATYELGDDMDSVVESYFFDKKDKTETAGSIDNQVNHIKVVGGRFSTNILEGLNIQGEVAHQSGTHITTNEERERDAWAFQGIAIYSVPLMEEYDPVLQYVFTKLYGDKSGDADDEYTGWDPFFESQGSGKIYNTIFTFTDSYIHELSLSFNPMEDVSSTIYVTKLYSHQDVSSDTTALTIGSTGQTITVPTRVGSQEIGTEIDVDTTYDYTEDVQLGLSVGVFKPGEALDNKISAKQVLASVSVAF